MPLHPIAVQASLLGEQEKYEQSQKLGTQALLEQDTLSRAEANISKHIVSYSLFGTEPLYGEGAILNAKAIQALLPNWQMRVYHDDSISIELIERLRQAGAQTVLASSVGIGHWPGTFWRFHVLSDLHAAKVIFRDADSLISVREVSLIKEWLQSTYPFHVMRDWYTHVELILAGLWGAHAPYLAHMHEWVEHYVAHELEHSTHDDQLFLAKYIWPRICNHTLVHDSVHAVLGAKDIAMPRSSYQVSATLGGYGAEAYPVTLDPPLPSQKYFIEISDTASGFRICRYVRTATNGIDRFRVPISYNEKIKSGVWKIAVGMAD